MGAFTLQDLHHENAGLSAVASDDEVKDFDIDSDIYNAESKQELNKLSPEKAQWELADATNTL